MKNFFKTPKRILSILLVLLMCSNSYAAVGGNDGSAFVTKAEFDALVNTFNEQMDNYEDALESKIDGAIANYLASLSTKSITPQMSLINSVKPVFLNTWAPFTTRIGTMYKYFYYVGVHLFAAGDIWAAPSNPDAGKPYQGSEAKYTNHSSTGDMGTWLTVNNGDNNKGQFVRYKKTTVGSNEILVPDARVVSVMSSAVECAAFSQIGGSAIPSDPKSVPSVTAKTTVKTGTTWGGQSEQYKSAWSNRNFNLNGIASFTVEDVITLNNNLTDKNFTALAGTSIPGTDVHSIYDEEYQTIGEAYTTAAAKIGFINSYGSLGWKDGTTAPANYKTTIYRHKYTTKKWSDFCHESLSLLMNEPIKYYEGCPLFTATTDGDCTLELVFGNSDTTATNVFMLSNAKFDNNATTGKSINIQNLTINGEVPTDANSYRTLANVTTTLKFTAKRDETYWIKVLPSKGRVAAVTDNIVIETE